jgi:hypothetical protein
MDTIKQECDDELLWHEHEPCELSFLGSLRVGQQLFVGTQELLLVVVAFVIPAKRKPVSPSSGVDPLGVKVEGENDPEDTAQLCECFHFRQ